MELTNKELWEKSAAFHGHVCPGLTIGYKAALYAKELLDLDFSEDEEVVCVTENDACGVDAIQVILGCSAGKGNLLFRIRGKQAYSFFNRKTGKSVRMVLKDFDMGAGTMDERQEKLFNTPHADLFLIKDVPFSLPEEARIFTSIACDNCGEKTAESFIHVQNEKKLCPDCYSPYSRFM